MKPLEEIFFRACVNEQKRKSHSSDRELSIRTIGNIFERLGFSYKQLMYYVSKWSDRGFYDYGVSLDLGWFEFDKLAGEYKQIYDSMTNTDGKGISMKQGKEILNICVNHENCQLDPADCIYAIEITTFKDACEGKRIFIPDIGCDK